MAHMATYTATDAGKMLAHYERKIGERDHISRDGQVYNLADMQDLDSLSRFQELTNDLDLDKRSRPLADIVLTLPKNYDGDSREFFEASFEVLAEKVGNQNVVSAFVHEDEPGAQPHMHFAFIPIVETPMMTNDKTQPLVWSKKDEQKNPAHKAGEVKRDAKGYPKYKRVPKLDDAGNPVLKRTACASQMFSRQDMKEFHGELEKQLCQRLNRDHVGVTLDENDKAKKWSKLDHDDFVAVTKAREKKVAEIASLEVRRSNLSRDVGELEGKVQELEEQRNSLAEDIGQASERLERLRQRAISIEWQNDGVRERNKKLKEERDSRAKRVGELESVTSLLGDFKKAEEESERCSILDRLIARCAEIVQLIKDRIINVREVPFFINYHQAPQQQQYSAWSKPKSRSEIILTPDQKEAIRTQFSAQQPSLGSRVEVATTKQMSIDDVAAPMPPQQERQTKTEPEPLKSFGRPKPEDDMSRTL